MRTGSPVKSVSKEKTAKLRYTFDIEAWVLLPDHMHCIWRLPKNDSNFSKR